jgi:hypothetical protein
MSHRKRSSPAGFRRALALSVAVHLAVAAVVALVARSEGDAAPPVPDIDPRILDVVVRMPTQDEPLLLAPLVHEAPAPDPPPAEVSESPSPSPPPPEPAGPPLVAAVPNPLPAELLTLLRRPGVDPSPAADPDLAPAGGVTASPLHGAMAAGQAVVYVLDCSGSMGEFGKFGVARAALVATLRRQPESVRFQVVVYAGTARPVFPGGFVPATAANVAAVEAHLAELRPSGPSNHTDAVRVAAAARPDVIVVLTDDADELSANMLKPVLAGAGRPVPVCVARVTADTVGIPQELR